MEELSYHRFPLSHIPDGFEWLSEYGFIGRYTRENIVVDLVYPTPGEETDLSEEELTEYLSCDEGLWKKWKYNLQCKSLSRVVMNLISHIPESEKSQTRVLRHLISHLDVKNGGERAILHGMWGGDFFSGRHPSEWTGTTEIMEDYERTGKPVKYAQCWVFSELLTSMLRFLNIPSRSVYVKNAHIDVGLDGGVDFVDSERTYKGESLSIDEFDSTSQFEWSGEEQVDGYVHELMSKGSNDIPEDTRDLIKNGDRYWNFHVWTEALITRDGVVGWQVCDPSPIEGVQAQSDLFESRGKFYGPCPVKSIRDGVKAPYDHPYLSSAVNSPTRRWSVFKKGPMKAIYPYRIDYSMLDNLSGHVRLVTLHCKGVGLRGNLNLTPTYRHDDKIQALRAYHSSFPLIIESDDDDFLLHVKNESIGSPMLVQLIFLRGDKILSCKREVITNLLDMQIPEIPTGSDFMSVLLIELDTRKFWPLIVSLKS
jgi:hypothetical protein